LKIGTRRYLGWFFRVAISVAILLWLLSRLDLRGLIDVLKALPVSAWLVAAVLYLSAQILSSARWWLLTINLNFEERWHTCLNYYLVGMYFNLFLPTGLGGDLFKVHFLSRRGGRKLYAAMSVIGDRGFGLGAMMILGAGAAVLYAEVLPAPFSWLLILSGVAMVCAIIGLPFLLQAMLKLRPQIRPYLQGVLLLYNKPRTLGAIFGLSLVLQVLGMIAVAQLGAGLGIDLPLAFYIACLPLITLLTLVPITFNGVGVREGAFVYFLGLKGIGAEAAMTLGLLVFSVLVATSLIGGAIYAMGLHRRAALSSS
jgi:uncharacterized membrane protein YbhN (UPF0104 family)